MSLLSTQNMRGAQLQFPFAPESIVIVASVPQRSPFRYPGGKTWLVPHVRTWLTSLSRKPKLLVEPFAGGAIVGLTAAFEDLADRVLLVERDAAVAVVWRVMVGKDAGELCRRILDFEMSLSNVKRALSKKHRTNLDRAFTTLLRNRVQHGGILAPGASVMKEGENGKGIGSRWYPETLARRITDIMTVRDRIGIVEGDAFDVIREYRNAGNAAWFVDPPYTVAGRRLYCFSDVDHPELFRAMSETRGDFLMTYDDTDEVRALAAANAFQVAQVAMKSRQHTTKKELLIARTLTWL